MATNLKTSSLAAAVFIGLFTGSSDAQERLDAKVPFSFVVRNKEFPAGRYEFTTTQGVLAIRGQDNDKGMFVMANPAGGHDPNGDKPVLVFKRFEKTYRLAEVWNSENSGSSRETPRSHIRAARRVQRGNGVDRPNCERDEVTRRPSVAGATRDRRSRRQ